MQVPLCVSDTEEWFELQVSLMRRRQLEKMPRKSAKRPRSPSRTPSLWQCFLIRNQWTKSFSSHRWQVIRSRPMQSQRLRRRQVRSRCKMLR